MNKTLRYIPLLATLALAPACKELPSFNNPLDPEFTGSAGSVVLFSDSMDTLSSWSVAEPFTIWSTWSNGKVRYCIGTNLSNQANPLVTSISKSITVPSNGRAFLWINKFYSSDTVRFFVDANLAAQRVSTTTPVGSAFWEQMSFPFPSGTHILRIEIRGKSSQTSFDVLTVER